MLIGLFISKDKKKSEDTVAMLKSKFQGIEFITLQDLNDDLTMASLAKGEFDKIIVYVSAFSGLRQEEILSELQSLKDYKDLRAHNVRIQVVDRPHPGTGVGMIDGAYRKMFGAFVDCQYFLKQSFTLPILVELIRDINIPNDKADNSNKSGNVNSSMVSALAKQSNEKPAYTVEEPEELPKHREVQPEVKSEEKPKEVTSPQQKPAKKKKGFSLFGRKKFNVVEPDLDSMESVEENGEVEELKEEESGTVEEIRETDEIQTAEPREVEEEEDLSEFLYDELDSKEIDKRKVYQSKHINVDSAVSREPEVVEDKEVAIDFKKLDSLNSTDLFNIPTELSPEEDMLNKQLRLKELELKTRMLEAQAKIKETEFESIQRETLLSPTRVKEERVTGYINSNRGRAKVILVTGLQSSGKTTAVKLIGEMLREVGFVINVDLDFKGRTLSESFSRMDENDLVRLGAFRSLRDINDIQKYILPIDGNLDVLGTHTELQEAEENSLEKRLDYSLIQPMLRKLSNSGVYGNVVVDCPLEVFNSAKELLDIADYVIWVCRGSRHGIKSTVSELSNPNYDEFFFNKLTLVLNGEQNQNTVWKRFFNTSSMMNDDIADSLGAIIPYIEDYDEYFWNDITGLELSDFRANVLEVLDLI